MKNTTKAIICFFVIIAIVISSYEISKLFEDPEYEKFLNTMNGNPIQIHSWCKSNFIIVENNSLPNITEPNRLMREKYITEHQLAVFKHMAFFDSNIDSYVLEINNTNITYATLFHYYGDWHCSFPDRIETSDEVDVLYAARDFSKGYPVGYYTLWVPL